MRNPRLSAFIRSLSLVGLLLSLVLPGFLQALPVAPLPRHIIVITANKAPITDSANKAGFLQRQGIPLERYNLDAVDALEARWSKDLPTTESAAKQAFEKRLNAVGKDVFSKELVEAYRGLSTAIQYKIDRYPAVIFDRQWIVYGVTDLEVALHRYAEFMARQGDRHE